MDLLTPEHPLVGCWETSVGPIGFRKDGHFVTTVLSSSGEWRVVDENRIEVIPRWGRLWGVEGPMNFSLIEDSTTKFQLLSKELRILIYRSYSDPQNCQEPWQLP